MIARVARRGLARAGVWPPTVRILLWLALCSMLATIVYLAGGQ